MRHLVKKRGFHFKSNNKINEVYGIMWIPKPENKIRAILQISHGMAEHIERYNDFANYMARRGILVVGNNHVGHGKSVLGKEDYGFFGKRNKKSKIDLSGMVVKDLYHVTKIMKKRYPQIPYFLLGHSMGSFMARRYIMNYGKEIDGVIIMGTNNQSKFEIILGIGIVKIFSFVMGERHRSKIVEKMMFGVYNDKVEYPKTKDDWICSNEKVVAQYRKDDACGFIFTMNGLDVLLSTLLYVEREKNIKKIPKSLPILINAGEDDPVGQYTKGVRKVYKRYKKLGVEDISKKFYKNMRHEILNEVDNRIVYSDIYKWLNKRINQKKV